MQENNILSNIIDVCVRVCVVTEKVQENNTLSNLIDVCVFVRVGVLSVHLLVLVEVVKDPFVDNVEVSVQKLGMEPKCRSPGKRKGTFPLSVL